MPVRLINAPEDFLPDNNRNPMDPLVFTPYFRPQVWGGRRLARLGKALPAVGQFGESWEISGHSQHVSRVAEGPLAGRLLTELWQELRPELAGDAFAAQAEFPLLIKYLDCHENLSVQVHPDDSQAKSMLGQSSGKTEAWVIVDVEPDARIYAGFRSGVTRRDVERCLAAGSLVECLHAISPRAGDCFFIPAGTVHALGGGLLVAEIQQPSDATFRLFDWNRLGSEGRPRQLHREESLAVIDWNAGPVQPATPRASASEMHRERLVECPYFRIQRGSVLPGESFRASQTGEPCVLMILKGEARGEHRVFSAGTTAWLSPSCAGMAFTSGPAGCLYLTATPLPRA